MTPLALRANVASDVNISELPNGEPRVGQKMRSLEGLLLPPLVGLLKGLDSTRRLSPGLLPSPGWALPKALGLLCQCLSVSTLYTRGERCLFASLGLTPKSLPSWALGGLLELARLCPARFGDLTLSMDLHCFQLPNRNDPWLLKRSTSTKLPP